MSKKGVSHILTLLQTAALKTNPIYRLLPPFFYGFFAPRKPRNTEPNLLIERALHTSEYLLPQRTEQHPSTPRDSEYDHPETSTKGQDRVKRQLLDEFDGCKTAAKRPRKEGDDTEDEGAGDRSNEPEHVSSPTRSSPPSTSDKQQSGSSSSAPPSSKSSQSSGKQQRTAKEEAEIKRMAMKFLDLEASTSRGSKKDSMDEYDSQFSRDFDKVCFWLELHLNFFSWSSN